MLVNEDLHTARLTLRHLSESDDLTHYHSWINDPETNKYLSTKGATYEQLKSFVRQKNGSPDAFMLGIFLGDRHIGNVKIEPENGDPYIGIVIDKGYWGQGYGPEAIIAMSNYARAVLGMPVIKLGVRAEHARAVFCYLKAGYDVTEYTGRSYTMTFGPAGDE